MSQSRTRIPVPRALALAVAVGLAGGGLAASAAPQPASAAERECAPAAAVIGSLDRYPGGIGTNSDSEMRASVLLRVPSGAQITSARYSFMLDGSVKRALTPIADVQSTIDDRYQEIARSAHEGYDLVLVSARGDAGLDGREGVFTETLEFSLSTGERLAVDYPVELVRSTGAAGRPAAVVPFDLNGWMRAPGRVGDNAQTSWGNTAAGASGQGASVPAGRFVLQAWNAEADRDRPANFAWQFVRVASDGSLAPASIAGSLSSPTLVRGSETEWNRWGPGTTLAAATGGSDIRFDEPGYYRLLMWPLGPAEAFDPGALVASDATQVGEAFVNVEPADFADRLAVGCDDDGGAGAASGSSDASGGAGADGADGAADASGGEADSGADGGEGSADGGGSGAGGAAGANGVGDDSGAADAAGTAADASADSDASGSADSDPGRGADSDSDSDASASAEGGASADDAGSAEASGASGGAGSAGDDADDARAGDGRIPDGSGSAASRTGDPDGGALARTGGAGAGIVWGLGAVLACAGGVLLAARLRAAGDVGR